MSSEQLAVNGSVPWPVLDGSINSVGLQALGPSVSLRALNFDNRDHLDLISEFLALHSPGEELFKSVTPSNELEDWRVVVTSVLLRNDKTLGILSFEYEHQEGSSESIVRATFVPPRDWTNSERRDVLETLRHNIRELAARQNWSRIVLPRRPGAAVLKEILQLQGLSNEIEITEIY